MEQQPMSGLTSILRIVCAGMLGTLVITGTAAAQQVHWNDPGPLSVGQRSALELVFENTEPRGRVSLPHIDGLSIGGAPSQSTSVSLINARRQSSYTLSYPVRPQRQGQIEIPAFEVETDSGTQTVAATTVRVGVPPRFGVAAGDGEAASDAVFARLAPSARKPFAGEVFDIDVLVAVKGGRHAELVGTPSWEGSGIVAEPFADGKRIGLGGGAAGVRFHTRALAPQPGSLDLPPVQQEVKIESGKRTRGSLFGRGDLDSLFDDDWDSLMPSFLGHAAMDDVTVTSDAAHLDVQPLPQPAPAGFSGAVGRFTLDSKLVPEEPKAGEPVTWTLTLKGTGNWPGGVELPARAIPTEFRSVQPKQRKEFAPTELFSGTLSEDVVLVPMKPGDYPLEPVRFVYFDPDEQRYETIVAQPPRLHVGGTAVAAGPAVAVAAGTTAPGESAASAPMPPQDPSPVDRLPRDPQDGTGAAYPPLPAQRVAGLAAIPLAVLASYWLLLALQRAHLTDPRRRQRQALARLRAAVEAARTAADVEQRSTALLAWQHAAATVLGLDLAAPTAAQLGTPAANTAIAESNERWIALWRECDRALYARRAELTAEWYERAAELCRHIRRPRINPLHVFLARNLLPKAALSALVLLALALPAHGDAIAEYTQGHFGAAQEQFRSQVQAAPTDWVARYNLGLTEAQQAAHGPAFAETAAAFVQQPRNEAVRWNLGLFAAQIPGLEPQLAHVAFGGGTATLARTFSPATWQAFLLAGAIVCCVGGALVLRRRYRTASARRHWLGRALVVMGAGTALSAVLALHMYGPLAAPNVAVVSEPAILRSVPTDAESTQQQKPITAGAMVVLEKHFLGWVKVAHANGETGWLRQSDLVPLYRAPSA